jgi:hypothetical protein
MNPQVQMRSTGWTDGKQRIIYRLVRVMGVIAWRGVVIQNFIQGDFKVSTPSEVAGFLRRNSVLLPLLIHVVAYTLSCVVDFKIGPGILDASATWKTQTLHFYAGSSVDFFVTVNQAFLVLIVRHEQDISQQLDLRKFCAHKRSGVHVEIWQCVVMYGL